MIDKNSSVRHSVLVIDDQESIREVVEDILDIININVILAANGQEGVELFTQLRSRIGLVLLDMQMPLMSGEETYWRIRELDAHIPIILSSGRGEADACRLLEGDGLDTNKVFFLRKPYAIDTLLNLVQTQLYSGSA